MKNQFIEKMIIFLLVVSFFSMNLYSLPVLAQEDEITIDEYMSELQETAASYGIECYLKHNNPHVTLTREMLEAAKEDIRQYAESFEVTEAATQELFTFPVYAGRTMTVTQRVSKSFTVSNSHGSAEMKFSANVTGDASNSHLISVSGKSVYQSGIFINFTSWTTESISCSLNNPSDGYMKATIKGRVTFSYTDPIAQVTTGNTSEITKTLSIKVF